MCSWLQSLLLNEEPVCARPPSKIGEYAELGDLTRASVKAEELEFLDVCKNRVEENRGKLKVLDINKVEKEMEVNKIDTLSSIIENLKGKFPGLIHMRIPVCNSASHLETDLDILCNNQHQHSHHC